MLPTSHLTPIRDCLMAGPKLTVGFIGILIPSCRLLREKIAKCRDSGQHSVTMSGSLPTEEMWYPVVMVL